MVRIDCLVFGYRKLKISPDFLSDATSALLRASIPSRINSDGEIIIRERDFQKIQILFQGRIVFEHTPALGLYGKIINLPHKIAYGISIAFSIVIILILSGLVWDIRVEGNLNITDSEVVLGLSGCGFSVGDFWREVDRGAVESKFLSIDDRVSWININRRGSVAYVSVIEKENEKLNEEITDVEFSNIISAFDCVIEEITVKTGTAAVKPGDVVKKGDLLISGVTAEEAGGRFCKAEGRVIGRISETVSVNVDRNYEKKTRTDKKMYSCSLNFFKKSLNIFKLYGNLTNKYDIIENEITYSLLGKCKLPFSISIKYIPVYHTDCGIYTDEELVSIASDRLDALTSSRLALSDLIKIKTSGNFTENGYSISSEITFLREIGEGLKFDVE